MNGAMRVSMEKENQEIDLMILLKTLWDAKWFVAAAIVVSGTIGFFYCLGATPVYEANSVIQIESKKKSLESESISRLADLFGSSTSASTEIELLSSRDVAGKTVEKLNLDIITTPNEIPFISELLRKLTPYDDDTGLAIPMWKSKYAWGGERISVTKFNLPDDEYGKDFTIRFSGNGWQLYDGDDVLLEGAVGQYSENKKYGLDVDFVRARKGGIFTIRKIHKLKSILQLQSKLVAEPMGAKTGVYILKIKDSDPELAKSVLNTLMEVHVQNNIQRNSAETEKTLEFLKSKLPDIKAELETAEQKLNDYQIQAESINVTAEAKSLLNQVVELEKSISVLQLKKADIERKFKPEHPNFQAWSVQMRKLEERKQELDARIGKLPVTQQDVVRLTRDVKVGNEIYLDMLSNIQELNILRAGTVGNVRVVDNAIVDITNPVEPRKRLIVAISLFMGGVLAVALVLLKSILNKRIESIEDVEKIGLSVYASIPFSRSQHRSEAFWKKTERNPNRAIFELLASAEPGDIAVEAFKSLRTGLHFGMLDAKNNILMITSASPDAGKTFISTNLAAVVAHLDMKILLIDADMRRGNIHELLGMEKGVGLSDILIDKSDLKTAVRKTNIGNLDFISSGSLPPNPSELLMSSRFEDFFRIVKEEYDLIVVDTPPVLAVTDASIIGRYAGTNMIVVKDGFNTPKEIQLSLTKLKQNSVEVKGAILNFVSKKKVASESYAFEYSSS